MQVRVSPLAGVFGVGAVLIGVAAALLGGGPGGLQEGIAEALTVAAAALLHELEALSDKIAEVFERGIIQTEALNYIRGRSIAQTYLIIDEAQNMTPNQVKGIITRAGKNTKIILIGDPNQIDKPFLDEKTNGLSYAAKYMKGSPMCWQLTLLPEECERSELAMDAIKRL